jgi:hypothetical protein
MIKLVSDIWQVSDILWVLLYMIKFVSDIWQVSDILLGITLYDKVCQ